MHRIIDNVSNQQQKKETENISNENVDNKQDINK